LHPGFTGPLLELWSCVSDAAAVLGAHEPAQLGFGKPDRVVPKHVKAQQPFVDAWLRALGAGEVTLYVSASRAGVALAPPGEDLVMCLGADVARGDGLVARARLGRALALLSARAEPLVELPTDELALLLAAAVKLGGGDPARVPALSDVASARGLDERAKALGKAMSKRGKKALPQALARLDRTQSGDLAALRLAARAGAARLGLIASGDVPAALAAATGGQRLLAPAEDPLALDLFVYALSEDHLGLRKELGL
jgi:hypothetical protein